MVLRRNESLVATKVKNRMMKVLAVINLIVGFFALYSSYKNMTNNTLFIAVIALFFGYFILKKHKSHFNFYVVERKSNSKGVDDGV